MENFLRLRSFAGHLRRNRCAGQFAQKAGKFFDPALAELKEDRDGLE